MPIKWFLSVLLMFGSSLLVMVTVMLAAGPGQPGCAAIPVFSFENEENHGRVQGESPSLVNGMSTIRMALFGRGLV